MNVTHILGFVIDINVLKRHNFILILQSILSLMSSLNIGEFALCLINSRMELLRVLSLVLGHLSPLRVRVHHTLDVVVDYHVNLLLELSYFGGLAQ